MTTYSSGLRMHNKLAAARLQWLEAQHTTVQTRTVSTEAEAQTIRSDREALGLSPATIVVTGVPRAQKGNTDAQN